MTSALRLDIMWDGSVYKFVCGLDMEVRAHCVCYKIARAKYGTDCMIKRFIKIFYFQCPPPATMPRTVLCLEIKIIFDKIALEIN